MQRRLQTLTTVSLATSLMATGLASRAFAAAGPQPEGAATAASIAAALQPFVDAGNTAGMVTLVASKDRVLNVSAIGYADLATKRPMRPDSLFWLASTMRPITATALMMLVDEGKVSLTDPVDKYLPEFKGAMVAVPQAAKDTFLLRPPARPIQVHDLLTHMSGLPAFNRIERQHHQHIDTLPLETATMLYALTPLLADPGTQNIYSNAGINTAGRIVEVVSGMPFEQFLQKRLFDPLKMPDTTFFPTAEQVGRLVTSYRASEDHTHLIVTPLVQLTYPLDGPHRYACPAGGLFSTAPDMGRFGMMILNGGVFDGKRYLSDHSLRQMTSTQDGWLSHRKPDAPEAGCGLGFDTDRIDHGNSPGPVVGKAGHLGMHEIDLEVDPDHGIVEVFMTSE